MSKTIGIDEKGRTLYWDAKKKLPFYMEGDQRIHVCPVVDQLRPLYPARVRMISMNFSLGDGGYRAFCP